MTFTSEIQEVQNRRNKSLFKYGLVANAKKTMGELVMGLGFFASIFALFIGGIFFFLITLGFFVAVGLYLMFSGEQDRFDYKMQSGTIIHQGDGRWQR